MGKQFGRHTKETKLAKKERLGKVCEWLIAGVPYSDICRMGAEQFDCTERAVSRYIKQVRETILPGWYEWGEHRLMAAEEMAKAERLYAKCIAKGDLRTAIRVLRHLAELKGLSAEMQVARERSTLKAELQDMRDRLEKGSNAGRELTLDAFNEVRALYGQPPVSQEDWDSYRDKRVS